MNLRVMIGWLLLACTSLTAAQGTAFQYVGTLSDAQQPAPTGSYDIQASLFAGPNAGDALLAPAQLLSPVAVLGGYFTINLDFGSAVLAPQAWLELAVRPTGGGAFDTLAPRQQVGHVPLALFAETTDWSGIANVPAEVLSSAALPTGIGRVAFTNSSGTVNLRVRQFSFSVSGGCDPVANTCEQTYFRTAKFLVEPSKDWGRLYRAITETTFTLKWDLYLDALAEPAGDYLARVENSQITDLTYESATGAGGADLLRVSVEFGKLTLSAGAGQPTFAWNASANTGTAVPPVCPAWFSSMVTGVIPVGFSSTALVVAAPPNLLDVHVNTYGLIGTGSATYTPPTISVPLDASAATAWRTLAVCSEALVSTKTALLPDPALSVLLPDATSPDNYSSRVKWVNTRMSEFALASDNQSRPTVSFDLIAPCIGVNVLQSGTTYIPYGWNFPFIGTCLLTF